MGNVGYITLADGSILGFDPASGAARGSIETRPGGASVLYKDKGLATDGRTLFATFGDNQLLAF